MNHFLLERRTLSAALIREPFKPGDPEHDKIFLLGRVEESGDDVTVTIGDQDPTYALNEGVLDEFDLRGKIPFAAEMENGERNSSGLYIMSSGSIVQIETGDGESFLPLLRRNHPTLLNGYLTIPNGRCGERPDITIVKECLEELLLLQGNSAVLPPIPEGFDANAWRGLKLEQIQHKREVLEKSGRDVDAILRSGMVTMSYAESPEDEHLFRNVAVNVCGNTVSNCRAIVCWVSRPYVNSVEFSHVLTVKIPALEGRPITDVMGIFDGEPFMREGGFFPLNGLLGSNELITPVLLNYLEKRRGGSPVRRLDV